MAYAAVISLKQTIERLQNACGFCDVSCSTRESLESAYEEAASLERVLKRLDSHGSGGSGERLDRLDGQMREAANEVEDFVELHQSEHGRNEVPLDWEQVRQEMGWFAERAKKLGVDYAAELDKPWCGDEGEGGGASSSNADHSGADDMVGYSDKLGALKAHMTEAVRPNDWVAASIFGRAGTGRSYVAWEIFQHVREQGTFECCVWATVGPACNRKAILLGILSRALIIFNGGRGGDGRAVEMEEDGLIFQVSDESYVRGSMFSILARRRYMIVLDDVGDTGILEYLVTAFPMQNNGSLVLVTTSDKDVMNHPVLTFTDFLEDPALQHQDIWWDLLWYFLFQLQPISPELEEEGRKLIRNCGDRYLCFVKLILFLWNAERSPQAWKQIADDQHHPIFQDMVDEISEVRKIKQDLNNFTASDRAALSHIVDDNRSSVGITFWKEKLFPKKFFSRMELSSFVGMPGIGKTALVEKVFEYAENAYDYSLKMPYFNHHAWVTLGPKYQSEDIVIDILAQIFPLIDKMAIKGDVELAADLIQQLSNPNMRLLIVLDDVWTEAPLEHLRNSFPNIRGRALVTTRMEQVGRSKKMNMVHEMHPLSKEESWKLLSRKVFVEEEYCPYDLVKSGKKIAENCDGLPLTILRVAILISGNLTAEYWNAVANKNSDFVSVLSELSKTLAPIYNTLPQHLKPCFLYMGAFSEGCEVPTSKIHRLWNAEGFLQPNPSQRVEDFAAECLSELVRRNLVMEFDLVVKTCRLNSVFWYLSNNEAVKSNFFYTLSTDAPHDSIKARRFCIRHCILLGIKDVYGSMMDSVSTAHSLLCTGAYHQYPVPIRLELELLRVLDALAVRLYDFPIEVVNLIHLRHLAITCDDDLPTTISKLRNLEFLIVSRHLHMASRSYLPVEIWDMKELRHVQVTGSNLPSPPTRGTVLPKLLTLLDVGYQTCTEEVLTGIPNLEKLGIQIELAPGEAPPFHPYLNRISNHLSKLESLECVVVNPEIDPEVEPPPPPHSMFPSSLKRLILSGLGYPWEYMDIIGRLKDLEALELRGYAFQGRQWKTTDIAFRKLQRLVIEDTDLVCWKTTVFSFVALKHLSIKHCYHLQVPTTVFLGRDTFQVVDCNPLAANWQEIIRKRSGSVALPAAMPDFKDLKVHMEFSWEVTKRKRKLEAPLNTKDKLSTEKESFAVKLPSDNIKDKDDEEVIPIDKLATLETQAKSKDEKKVVKEEMVNCYSSLPAPLKKLCHLFEPISGGGLGIRIKLDVDVFGCDLEILIVWEDVVPFSKLEPITGNCIVAYVWHLYKNMKGNEKHGRFLFVNPFSISHVPKVSPDDRAHELANRLLDATSNQLVLVPCNVGEHWILTIIEPYKDHVYLIDPLTHQNRDATWKYVVDTAMTIFNASKEKKKFKEALNWEIVKGPMQPDSKQCGFYVMRFMKEIVIGIENDDSTSVTSLFQDKNCKYSQCEIDEVREDWASCVINEIKM